MLIMSLDPGPTALSMSYGMTIGILLPCLVFISTSKDLFLPLPLLDLLQEVARKRIYI